MIKIPLAKPLIENDDIYIVNKALKSGWVSSKGPYIKKFEKKFQKFLGGGYAVSVSNGTAALELGIKSLGIKPGDEIIVPNFTFAASINAIMNCGAIPVLADVEDGNWTIKLSEIKKKITKKTKAIMLVHVYGQPCYIDEIKKFSNQKKILIIEDCAEALGSRYKKKTVGLDGDCSCHSFFANKTITTGEGGMVVFKNKKFFEKAQIIKNHGMSYKRKYFHEFVGSNYRLTNIQAAFGYSQLKKIKKILNIRKKIFDNYNKLLSDDFFYKIPSNNWSTNSYWLYYIIVKRKINRDRLIKKLLAKGIEVRPTFYPLHLMNIYKDFAKGSFKNSEKIGFEGICLPSSGISFMQQKYIVSKLMELINLQ
jgi:perosamine synthetase